MATLELLNSALAVTGTVANPLEVRCTDRLNAIGDMAFTCYVGSPGAASLAPGVYVRWSDGSYVFEGVVDTVGRVAQDDGSEVLTVTCAHIARELAWVSAGLVALSSGSAPITVTGAIAALMAAGPGASAWTVTPSAGVGALTVFLQNDGASQFTLLLSLADKVGAWLVRAASGRALSMTAAWANSGVTARSVQGDKPANVAALLSLTREVTAAELVTVIFPFTAGNAAVRLGVQMASAALPAGYTKAARSWGTAGSAWAIRNTAAVASYGERERFVQFADINPLSNSNPDIISAANALQAAAVNWLASQAKQRIAYTLTVDDSPAPVLAGQSLTVQAPDLDTTLYCVESTHVWAPNAALRSTLRVTDGSPWPMSGADEQVRAMEAARVYRAHAQLAPNVYQLGYTKPVDAQYGADFRFRFDEGITQVLMVALDVQLQPLQSTVRALGAQGTRTGTHTEANHNHTVSQVAHTHGVPAHQHATVFTGHMHFGGIHTHGISTIAHTHSVQVTRVSTGDSDFGDVRLGLPPGTVEFLVKAGSGIGTVQTVPTTSTGGAGTDTGNGGNVATQSGLIGTINTNVDGATTTDSANANFTVGSGGGFTHDHTVDMTVTMEYGIYRDSAANTFALADLQYQINNGAWTALSGATSMGDGWYRIPLTNALVDAVTFYPLAKSNKVTVRAAVASAAQETFVVGGTPTGLFNRWNDAGVQQQQIAGGTATALALSPNNWLYLLRKALGTVTVYQPDAGGALTLWETWAIETNKYNAITVDTRTGKKWWCGDAGQFTYYGQAGPYIVAGTPNLTAIAAFNDLVYMTGGTQMYLRDFRTNGALSVNVAAGTSAGLPMAVRNDGRVVQPTSSLVSFAIKLWEADLSASTNYTRSDTGNAWTPLAIASAANLVHVGCSDGRVRTYILEGTTATLVWTSTGTPGATGYPTDTTLLGVSAVLSSKAAMIDAQLTVRSVVQGIVMT